MTRPFLIATALTAFAALAALAVMGVACAEPLRQDVGDKVEVVVQRRLPADSLQRLIEKTDREIAEQDYYLRIHQVTEEGYHLVAAYNTKLRNTRQQLQRQLESNEPTQVSRRLVLSSQRPMIAVSTHGGYWRAGHFIARVPLQGAAIRRDSTGRIVRGVWDADTIVKGWRSDSAGFYSGQFDAQLRASGQGYYVAADGIRYEGLWHEDKRHGFGFESSPFHHLRAGEWREGRYMGERMEHSSKRIYGIDISRHQHEKGRRRYGINWRQLRITSLGVRHHISETLPVAFVYIKATEGTSIRNRYFATDYAQARRKGIHAGAYHFFSLRSSAAAQAYYFLRHATVKAGDFPPVLDVEPTHAQVRQIGGAPELMRRIRTWMSIVEKATGKHPILYVSQSFVNQYMTEAADIKQKYNVWIARYGEYRPDVKLAFWQLCSDGRVAGIQGPVDINVFNGYQGQFDEFLRTGVHR